MASFVHRRGWFGWGGFVGRTAASAPAGGVAVVVTYAKALRPAPALAQFTATVAGVARGVTAVTVGGAGNTQLTFTLAAGNLTAGQPVAITYTPSGVAGERLAYVGPPVSEFPAGVLEVVAG